MAIITITRGRYGGGEELAHRLAQELGAECLSSEVLVEAAQKFQVEQEKIFRVLEEPPSFWERLMDSRRVHLAYIQASLAEYVARDSLVYHGNAGQELLRGLPHVLKVRLVYPVPLRAKHLAEQHQCSQEQALRRIDHIDEERTRRTRYLFQADWRQASRYDLVLHMERIPPEHALRTILDTLRLPSFQLAEGQRTQFEDFLLLSRVQAHVAGILQGRLAQVQVLVQGGEVRLEGTLSSGEALVERIVREIGEIPGVQAVHNEIVSGLAYQEWQI